MGLDDTTKARGLIIPGRTAYGMLPVREIAQDPCQQAARTQQLHLDRRHGPFLQPGYFRNLSFLHIKEVENRPLGPVKPGQPIAQKGDTSLQVQALLQTGRLREVLFIDRIQVFHGAAPPPVIPYRVADNLAK
ncbi:MAG TPA: hypothetical protein VFR05_03045 [Terriglobia bacterium]|nr:hypothetical protein [Terriglobia bacterium]